MIEVLRAGLLTTVQDRGRHGHAALGIGASGPMDPIALRLANALAGNAPDAAVLEIGLLGPRLRFTEAAIIAVAGAPFDAHAASTPLPAWCPVHIEAGTVLDFGHARRGAWACIAVAGGVDAPRLLGSASSDVNARLGRAPLRDGERIGVRSDGFDEALAIPAPGHRRASPLRALGGFSLDPRAWFDADPSRPIRLVPGSHAAELDAASREALLGGPFRVAADSNRVGLRLDGPRLALRAPLELVSEPVAAGTLQLPPGGQPIALMAEHPTTGGYPRIGQVAAIDLPRLAQRRPGDGVRFTAIDLDEAQTRYLAREYELDRLCARIAARLEGMHVAR
ncbi:MAG: biotin-dependent carboxyltransferase family protein [Dokdonella sp.]|uniref:5-oxoprolinase subunit C family protein n=1 Tax=Dokdonella sp. TaxID=2291710 RepID=UPI003F7FEB00